MLCSIFQCVVPDDVVAVGDYIFFSPYYFYLRQRIQKDIAHICNLPVNPAFGTNTAGMP